MSLSKLEEGLAAVGASVGVNCYSCLEYYVSEGQKAGLSRSQLLEALETANKIKRDSHQEFFQIGRKLLDADPAVDDPHISPNTINNEGVLAALGAAYTSQNYFELEKHLDFARKMGFDMEKTSEALRIARAVQKIAGELSYRKAMQYMIDEGEGECHAHGSCSCQEHN